MTQNHINKDFNILIYFIAFTVRSGRNYLCSLLKNNGFGNPDEYFQNIKGNFKPQRCQQLGLSDDAEPYQFFTNLLNQKSVNGIFATKFLAGHYQFMLSKYSKLSYEEKSSLQLDDVNKWIWIKRNDKVSQAISLFKAMRSNQWVSYNKIIGEKYPEYNFQEIRKNLDILTTEESWWEIYWRDNNITPYTIVYEQFTQKPAWFISEISKYICLGTNKKPLEESDVILKSPYQVQRDEYSEYLKEKFVQDLEAIGESID